MRRVREAHVVIETLKRLSILIHFEVLSHGEPKSRLEVFLVLELLFHRGSRFHLNIWLGLLRLGRQLLGCVDRRHELCHSAKFIIVIHEESTRIVVERALWERVDQKALDDLEYERDVPFLWIPVFLESIHAYFSFQRNIGMKNFSEKEA